MSKCKRELSLILVRAVWIRTITISSISQCFFVVSEIYRTGFVEELQKSKGLMILVCVSPRLCLQKLWLSLGVLNQHCGVLCEPAFPPQGKLGINGDVLDVWRSLCKAVCV
eukprot:g12976.t1